MKGIRTKKNQGVITKWCAFHLQVPEAFQGLIDNIHDTIKTTVENEEGVPIEYVTNMDEVI